ncbi:MAG: amidinotransferase family protein [Labilithrix sp.]|nr:amidinotransferase family protein [Labilithrix sp.]
MRIGSVRASHAVRQHETFVRALEVAGAVVDVVPFVHGAYDSVFSKDNAVLVERTHGATEALLARPRHAERRSEQLARADALASLGVRVTAAAEAPLEGGDVVVLPGARGALLGHGFRSSRRAARDLERFLERDVTSVELREPRLYHLDMALTVLDDATALVCEEAFTPASMRAIESHPGICAIVRVPFREALRFGVNLVQVGETIVWGATAPATTKALVARGYRVHRLTLEQFHRAGGSAACLVSRIHRQTHGATVDLFMTERSSAA